MLIRLLVVLGVMFTSPAYAQRLQIGAKASGVVYSAHAEQGWGFGGSARLNHGSAEFSVRAEAGAYFLDVLSQDCTLDVPGNCTPASPPPYFVEIGVTGVLRPLKHLELGLGPSGVVRGYRTGSVINPAVSLSGTVLLSRRASPAIELRHTRLIGERSGGMWTAGLAFLL